MRNEQQRLEAVLRALDEASGGDTPRHWSTWRHVIAEAVCAAAEWTPPPPPPPRCPGCGVLVDGTERMDQWRGGLEVPTFRVMWVCCGSVRSYATFQAYAKRYEDAADHQ